MSYRQRDSLASYNRITTTTTTTTAAVATTTTTTTATTTTAIVITTTIITTIIITTIVITIDVQTWEMFIDMYDIIIMNAMHKISIHVIFEY